MNIDAAKIDAPMPSTHGYGRALLPLWQIEPGIRFVNHGAFGATPRIVKAEQDRWRARMEANTARFFMIELPDLLRQAAAVLAAFVGTAEDRLAFVENASCGTGAVLNSIGFRPGDEILTTDHVYGAARNAMLAVGGRTGAVVVEARVPLPLLDGADVVRAIQTAMTEKTRLVVIDHVTSASAVEFPVKEIAALCRLHDVPLLIDGAHAPGMLDLDVDSIGADWYVGNCHKWLCAPKGAAFLAIAASARAASVRPLVISHAFGQGFPKEFDKVGTRDASAWLSVPAAIDFHRQLGGDTLRLRNRQLAADVGRQIAAEAGTSVAGIQTLTHSMVAIRMPGDLAATREESFRLRDFFYENHGVEVAMTGVAGVLHLRLSVHAYNEAADYAGLGAAIANVARARP